MQAGARAVARVVLMTIVRGDVFCVWDRALGWRNSRKCRPCVVLSLDGAGGVSVSARTTHPRDPRTVIASALVNPPFDLEGWLVVIPIQIADSDLLDHKGICPAQQLAALATAVMPRKSP
jgi:hypothetical protein